MACQTCDHTMQSINREPAIHWCPRCGSIKADTEEQPMLVGRVVDFASHLTDDHEPLIVAFERLGIRESIMVDSGMI